MCGLSISNTGLDECGFPAACAPGGQESFPTGSHYVSSPATMGSEVRSAAALPAVGNIPVHETIPEVRSTQQLHLFFHVNAHPQQLHLVPITINTHDNGRGPRTVVPSSLRGMASCATRSGKS